MNPLIDPINRALADDADAEARRAGATACRTLLAALEAEPGKEIMLPGAQPQPVSPLSTMSADQFFDVLIAKLKGLVDAKDDRPLTARTTSTAPLRIPMIVLPPSK